MKRYVLLVILGLIVLGTCGFVYEFILSRGDTPPIRAENAVASLEKVRLGGVNQWVLIRGHDPSNPVLLFLHGGPGMPAMYLAHAFQRELERDFVVVHWDRRGAGKSFDAAEPRSGLTIRQTLDDLYDLTDALRTRFDRERIMLLGHSWGSYLGLLAVREHPEFYSAYVGTGQLAGTREEARALRRDFVMRRAAAAGDSALVDSLEAGADLTEDDLFRYGGELFSETSFIPILTTGLMAPEYTLRDAMNVKAGADLVGSEMQYDVDPKPLEGEIDSLDVPVFFLLGRQDYNTPSTLAADYLENRLDAPLKRIIWFDRSAHFPFFEEPQAFHEAMLQVRRDAAAYWAPSSR